jgi:hypothetical protein
MPQTATHSLPARRPMMAPPRELIWIQEPHFLGWGCSECAWVFNPSGPPVGNSFQEMKENYLRLRDEESAAHICAEHPRATKARVQIIQDVGQSLHRIPQRDTWARQGVARQGRRAGSSQKRVSANSSFSRLRYPRH